MSSVKRHEFGETFLAKLDKAPVSGAAIGTIIGAIVGVGFASAPAALIGGAIGGVLDIFIGAAGKKEARDQMKRDFFRSLLTKYNKQVFVSALERMAPSMVYLQSLGLKPGTTQFEEALKKKLYAEIGYKGNCNIDLYGPAPPRQKRPLLAEISRTGKIKTWSPHIDQSVGPIWAEACKETYLAALRAWAEEKKETILFERELKAERESARRRMITRTMVNVGIALMIMGYVIRQKRKIE